MNIDRPKSLLCVLDLIKLIGASGNENLVSDYIQDFFNQYFPEAEQCIDDANNQSPFAGNTGNLIIHLDGTGVFQNHDRIMLSAHMDTVPLCVGVQPIIDDDKIFTDKSTALGADNRSGCAAIITVAREIKLQNLEHPPLSFLFTVQEEVGLVGASCLTPSFIRDVKNVINIDGGEADHMVIGGIGGVKWKAQIKGIASHAGVHPKDGVSAIMVFATAFARLSEEGWHGAVDKEDSYGTANIGSVKGGAASNVVMDNLEFAGECRSHDLVFRDLIYEHYKTCFEQVAKTIKNNAGDCADVHFEIQNHYPSFKLADDNPLIKKMSDCMVNMGLNPITEVCDGGMDANYLSHNLSLPVVTIGSGGHHIHTVDEIMILEEYYNCCEFLLAFIQMK